MSDLLTTAFLEKVNIYTTVQFHTDSFSSFGAMSQTFTYRMKCCVLSAIQGVFSSQCGCGDTEAFSGLQRQVRRVPLGKGVENVYPLCACVRERETKKFIIYSGLCATVYELVGGCWCEDKRWSPAPLSSWKSDVYKVTGRWVEKRATQAWMRSGPWFCVWELCIVPRLDQLRVHPGKWSNVRNALTPLLHYWCSWAAWLN